MARKETLMDQLTLLDHGETAGEGPLRRSRSKGSGKPDKPEPRSFNLLYLTIPAFAVGMTFVAAMAFHWLEAFLINDPRFRLERPEGNEAAQFLIEGRKRAEIADLLRVFEPDFGRSLYLLPVADRRAKLLGVDWVKEATVSRRWPNRIALRIEERHEVAFVEIRRSGKAPGYLLVDQDGVLLPVPQEVEFNLPVLKGIGGNATEQWRKVRVGKAMQFLEDLGPLAPQISEINPFDPADLKARLKLEGTVLTVRIGSHNYRKRLSDLIEHFSEIRERLPDARVFDLRIDGRITVVEGAAVDQW